MKQKYTFFRRKSTRKIAKVSPSNNNYSFRIKKPFNTQLLSFAWKFVLLAATLFFAASVGWSSFLEVDSPAAAMMFCAALSRGFVSLAAMLIFDVFSVVASRMLRRWYVLHFQLGMVGMLAATGALWSFCQGLRR